jgi:porin
MIMTRLPAFCLLLPLLVPHAAPAQQVASEAETDTRNQPASEPPVATTQPAFFRLDYSGDLVNRPALTGDWLGARNELAEDGIAFNVEVLQFMQGNAHGGKDTGIEYFGSADYILQFDTSRMGLWPGGYAKLRGETPFGRNLDPTVGAVSSPNYDALFPMPNDPGLTTLTEAWFMQFLSEKLYVLGGKIDLSRLPGANEFASDYYSHFLNTSLWQNPVGFSTIPYTTLAAGVGYIPTKWFDGLTMVLDPYGTPTRTGFDTAFHSPDGVTVLQALNFHVEPFGLKGNHRFLLSWSSRDKIALEDIGRLLISGQVAPSFSRLDVPGTQRGGDGNRRPRGLLAGRTRGRMFGRSSRPDDRSLQPRRVLARAALSRMLEPTPRSDDWMIAYDFDQYLYMEPDDPKQGFGVFGRFGWSPGELNPASSFYSIGVGGMGVVPTRDRDRFGIGYYLLNLSDDLPGLLGVNAEQGVEAFYNIEVTPWLHITPDLQVIIDPGGGYQDRDVAIVYGIRAQMSL